MDNKKSLILTNKKENAMIKIYVAGHDQRTSRKIAEMLPRDKVQITASWLYVDMDFEKVMDEFEKMDGANRDVNEILDADAILFLASLRRSPGGKHVELGVAIGAGKKVFAIGHRENFLMFSDKVSMFDSVEDFINRGLA